MHKWILEKPYKSFNAKNQIRIKNTNGYVLFTGYCKDDDMALKLIKALNFMEQNHG